MKVRAILLVLGIVTMSAAQAVDYIKIAPLSQVVKGSVGDVAVSDPVIAPIITWGGDIATIHANGDSVMPVVGSEFSKQGLKIRLLRQDDFVKQIESYLSGETPYLRGTIGMLNQASDVLQQDPRTKPVIIHQLTWSVGGDALVVKGGINNAKDLKGKTIALQAYGPHVDYMLRILSDAGLSTKDVNIRWVKDLTGTEQTPMAAFYQNDIDAAFVIIPDALALTSGGSVGSGAEDSVKGAKILLSTKTASRIIADVYAVRADYFKAHRDKVEKFVRALMKATDSMRDIVKNKAAKQAEYQKMMRASALALLDSEQALADTEGMYHDAEFVGFDGNVQFLSSASFPRRVDVLNQEVQAGLAQLGLVKGDVRFAKADWNFALWRTGEATKAPVAKFDESKVASVVSQRQKKGSLQQGELFHFEVYFAANQNNFSVDFYKYDFDKVINMASTYGGAVITVEGHSDPMGYLRKHKEGAPQLILGQIKQSAKNLSLSRAQAVRDNIIQYAGSKGISLDPSQFAVVGHGIAEPKSGICGNLPCAPKNEKEWRENMRVEFRVIQIEAEESVFKPL